MQELEIGEYYMYRPPQINNTNHNGNQFTNALFSNHTQSESQPSFSTQYAYYYIGSEVLANFNSNMIMMNNWTLDAPNNSFVKINDPSLEEIKKYRIKLAKTYRHPFMIHPWKVNEDGTILNYVFYFSTLMRNALFSLPSDIDTIKREVARILHTNGKWGYYLWKFANKDKK